MAVKRKTTYVASEPVAVERVRVRETSSLNTMFSMLLGNVGTGLLIVAAFLIGMLWSEVKYLRKGVTPTAVTTTADTTAAAQQAPAGPKVTKEQLAGFLNDSNYIHFGKADSKLVFTEISDPSCPYCHIAGGENLDLNKSAGSQFMTSAQGGSYVPPLPEMRKLVDAGKAAFIWMYYPGHGAGEVATLALYCANDKGKFWEAHDLVMSAAGYTLINDTVKNDRTKTGQMADFLKSVVDPTELKTCIDSGKYDARLASEQAAATSLGMTGTPLFFVNTTAFPGAYSYNDMKSAVDSTL